MLSAADAETDDFAPIPGSADNGDGTFTAPGMRDDSGAVIAAAQAQAVQDQDAETLAQLNAAADAEG